MQRRETQFINMFHNKAERNDLSVDEIVGNKAGAVFWLCSMLEMIPKQPADTP